MSTTELGSPPEAKKIRLEEDRNSNDQDDLAIVSEISTPVTDSHGIQSGNNVLKNENTESTAVTEEDVGIFQYISPSIPGFTGIIKERFNDFLVNEVDRDGNTVHLQSTEVPKPQVAKLTHDSKENPTLSKEDIHKLLEDVVGKETGEQIQKMLENPGDKKATVTCPPQEDKLQRAQTHQLFKEHFKNKLVTTTIDGSIVVRWWRPSDKNDKRTMKDEFDALGGPYLQFSMYKENKDTMEAINSICKTCRLAPKSVGYAGTKDKRAITVQNVTAYHAHAEKLARAQEVLNQQGIYVANFKYVKDALKLGDLKGNRFGIVLRNVAGAPQETIEMSLRHLKENGFINYYGMQRFGTGSISTHTVGQHILKADWKEAINLILKPRATDRYDWAKARKIWEDTQDPEKAIQAFPKKANLEIGVLKRLKQNATDYSGAFSSIPRNMRLMYVHAYQSFVWNHAASERIRLYGAKNVVIGDIVLLNGDLNDSEKDELNDKMKQQVKLVTDDDLNKYSIFDVVLPQPGYDVIYPDNEVFSVYKTIMKQDGLDPHNMNTPNKEYRLPGTYRRLMGMPSQIEWSFIRYDNPTMKLCRTDADILNGEPENESNDGQYLGLRLYLSLASSQYATMVLREVMKQQTSAAYHSTLKRAREEDAGQQP
ncbi:pseudouridine synthase [Umbelopsis sp. PMI_123]|nr:pseudouridine synthase [Umbelopsis sp. PMI_123]